jgi:hypothetical protein
MGAARGTGDGVREAHSAFESECPGYCRARDRFHVDTLMGVGRVYQQPFLDTYTKLACAQPYDRKTPLVVPTSSTTGARISPFASYHTITDASYQFAGPLTAYLSFSDSPLCCHRCSVRQNAIVNWYVRHLNSQGHESSLETPGALRVRLI